MEIISLLIQSILYILPSYFANSIPVVLGGGAPLDNKKKMKDGFRIFGDGKTTRGFFAGVLAGILVGAIEGAVLPGTSFAIYGSAPSTYILAGFLLGAGTMVGDLVGSFIKRRSGVAQGKPSVLMDQLMFLAFAFLFSYPLAQHLLSLEAIAFLAILTYFVHVAANVIAHRWGLKRVPW
ncbi:MAG: CDP-2,3-bis-(O-geranylgeranyl)-sn-glycerol synthase [Candidatus Micrarchaeota archaeon]|nr:CDP-2,3-bis-(O-geranylgeranyl)-sn-glycerol synthase [Candidatus Micrarchaeota archaeon]